MGQGQGRVEAMVKGREWRSGGWLFSRPGWLESRLMVQLQGVLREAVGGPDPVLQQHQLPLSVAGAAPPAPLAAAVPLHAWQPG